VVPVPPQQPVTRIDQTGKENKSGISSPTVSPVADKTKGNRAEAGNGMATGRMDKSPSLLSPTGQAEAEYRRAQGLLAQGNATEAEMALNQALRLAPEHAAARQALFALLVDLQRKDEAQSVLETGLSILPGHSVWAMNIARLQMEKGDAVGAWETLQRSLGSAQNNGEYRAFCGTVLQRLGRPKDAIEHFHAALRINPGEGRWWLGLALVLESAGHPAEAREAYARAKATGNLPTDLAAFAEQKSRQP
jgi:MSHA biogenesis protein MshN